MKLVKEEKPKVVVPINANCGFYKCTCGNILTGFLCQPRCEACGADFDWENVRGTYVEPERKKKNASKD